MFLNNIYCEILVQDEIKFEKSFKSFSNNQ